MHFLQLPEDVLRIITSHQPAEFLLCNRQLHDLCIPHLSHSLNLLTNNIADIKRVVKLVSRHNRHLRNCKQFTDNPESYDEQQTIALYRTGRRIRHTLDFVRSFSVVGAGWLLEDLNNPWLLETGLPIAVHEVYDYVYIARYLRDTISNALDLYDPAEDFIVDIIRSRAASAFEGVKNMENLVEENDTRVAQQLIRRTESAIIFLFGYLMGKLGGLTKIRFHSVHSLHHIISPIDSESRTISIGLYQCRLQLAMQPDRFWANLNATRQLAVVTAFNHEPMAAKLVSELLTHFEHCRFLKFILHNHIVGDVVFPAEYRLPRVENCHFYFNPENLRGSVAWPVFFDAPVMHAFHGSFKLFRVLHAYQYSQITKLCLVDHDLSVDDLVNLFPRCTHLLDVNFRFTPRFDGSQRKCLVAVMKSLAKSVEELVCHSAIHLTGKKFKDPKRDVRFLLQVDLPNLMAIKLYGFNFNEACYVETLDDEIKFMYAAEMLVEHFPKLEGWLDGSLAQVLDFGYGE